MLNRKPISAESPLSLKGDDENKMSASEAGLLSQSPVISTRVESAPLPPLLPLGLVASSSSWPGIQPFSTRLTVAALERAPEDKMQKVWKFIERTPPDQEDAEVTRAEIIYDIKELFTATFADRPVEDDPIVRSVDHCVRETTQVMAWILMRYILPQEKGGKGMKPWAIHYKHHLLELMYEASKWLQKQGFKANLMAHIMEAKLELNYNDFTEHDLYKSFYGASRFKLLDGTKGQIAKFDPNLQLIIPSCYGYEDIDQAPGSSNRMEDKAVSQVPHTIGGAALENVVDNYIKIFNKPATENPGPENITIFLGEYDAVNVPLAELPQVAKKKLDAWLAENEEFIQASGIKLSTFAELAATPYYKAAEKLMTLFLLEMLRTKRQDLIRWIAGDISRYLEKIGKSNSSFNLSYNPKATLQPPPSNVSPPKKSHKTSPTRTTGIINNGQAGSAVTILLGDSQNGYKGTPKQKTRRHLAAPSALDATMGVYNDDNKEHSPNSGSSSMSISSLTPMTPLTPSPLSGMMSSDTDDSQGSSLDLQDSIGSPNAADSLMSYNSGESNSVSTQASHSDDTNIHHSLTVMNRMILDKLETISTKNYTDRDKSAIVGTLVDYSVGLFRKAGHQGSSSPTSPTISPSPIPPALMTPLSASTAMAIVRKPSSPRTDGYSSAAVTGFGRKH